MLASADPTDFGKSILTVLARSAARPTEVTGAWLSFANALEYTADHCAGRHSQPANYPKRSRGMLSVSAESISRKVSAENVSRTPR